MSRLSGYNLETRRLDSGRPSDLVLATTILKQGGIVALPTETVYGLAANGLNETAILKVFSAKDRPLKNPLILHSKDSHDAKKLFDLPSGELAESRFLQLAARFWPGPLTIIAKRAAHVLDLATASLPTVAVRVPDNAATLEILAGLDFPLVMPSANLSTRPSPTRAHHVLKTLDKRIDAVLDGGVSKVGIESTVVRIDSSSAQILRLGAISVNDIEHCLKEKVLYTSPHHEESPRAPGQAWLHYSPRVASVISSSMKDAHRHWQKSDRIILAKRSDFLALSKELGPRSSDTLDLILSDEPKLFMQELYDALYLSENTPEKKLLLILPAPGPDWDAIIDRLSRSAGLERLL